MDKISMVLKVFFSDPFWIGIIERRMDNKLEVCKITFGIEPKEQEILQMLEHTLIFSPAVHIEMKDKKVNPKRKQREVRKEMSKTIGTKSQQALKLQHEQCKEMKKAVIKTKRKEQATYQFQLKQQKRKEKHRGR